MKKKIMIFSIISVFMLVTISMTTAMPYTDLAEKIENFNYVDYPPKWLCNAILILVFLHMLQGQWDLVQGFLDLHTRMGCDDVSCSICGLKIVKEGL